MSETQLFYALFDMVKWIADADMKANGHYANAPYAVYHEGTRYVARVRMVQPDANVDDNAKPIYRLEIERPMSLVGQGLLS